MGSYRYEVKRGLNLVAIDEEAVEGSIGSVVKAMDFQKFGGGALFENWSGLPTATNLNTGTTGTQPWNGQNTNLYHPFGAFWRGGVQGASGSAMIIGDIAVLTAGTATTNTVSLGAYKPFYLNRHTTWNGAPSGIVFEALVNFTDTNASVFNAFVGMANIANPGVLAAASPAYTAKTTNIKRWGFMHYGTTAAIFTNSALGSGSYTYFGTSTVTDTSATKHVKAVLTMNPWVQNGTTFNNSILYYINDTLVDVVDGSAASFPASGEVPYYPYIYVEALGAVGVDGRALSVKGAKVYYF